MKASRTGISIIILFAVALVLSACGGGGGSTAGEIPPATYSIMGIVSGAPQGTTVTLSGDKAAVTTTNSIGFYQFTGLSWSGSYTVIASMPGYTLSPASHSVTISSANAVNRNFAVVFGIAGSVKTGVGAGVASATVTLVSSSGSFTTRTTDANGDYSALGLAAGTYTLSASAGGYAMSPFNQKATVTCDVRTIDFTATAGTTYSILGTAWSDSSHTFPQSSLLMVLSGDNSGIVYTSASGTYAFSGLLSGGSYTVKPSRFSIQEQSYTPPVVLSSDIIWDFVGTKMATVSPQIPVSCMDLTGAITGPAGNGASLDILYRYYSSATTATSDSGGNYLKSVASGSYVITPLKTGYTFVPPRICGGDDTCNISSTVTITTNFSSQ